MNTQHNFISFFDDFELTPYDALPAWYQAFSDSIDDRNVMLEELNLINYADDEEL